MKTGEAVIVAQAAIVRSEQTGEPVVLPFSDELFDELEEVHGVDPEAMEGRCTNPDCEAVHEAYCFSGDGWTVILVMLETPVVN